MTMARRGICPHCGRYVALRTDGSVYPHNWPSKSGQSGECPGTGQAAESMSVREKDEE